MLPQLYPFLTYDYVRNDLRHTISITANVNAIYLATIVDLDTTFCLLEDYDTNESSK